MDQSYFQTCGLTFFNFSIKKSPFSLDQILFQSFSVRVISALQDVLILLRNAVTSMAVDPVIPYQLAISSSDGVVRLYDRRMLKTQDTHGRFL